MHSQSTRRGHVDGRQNRTASHHSCRRSRSQNERLVTRSGIGKDICSERLWEHDRLQRLQHFATAVLVEQQVVRLLLVWVTQGDGDEVLEVHSSGYSTENITDLPDDSEYVVDARGRRKLLDGLGHLASLVDVLALTRRDDSLRVEVQDLQRRGHVGTLTNYNGLDTLWTMTVRLTVTLLTAQILLNASCFTVEGELMAFVLVERVQAIVNAFVGTASNGSNRPVSELLDRCGSTVGLVGGISMSTSNSTDTVGAGSR